LDVLAGYKTSGHISGETRINGQPKTDRTWRSIAGYCEQVDLHCPALTVRESLVFATRLRLRPFSLPEETRLCLVNQIMNLLDLEEVADMLVGDEAAGEGLPKHARKRLTVGVELAGNPSILFADEPSSGLDSLGASVVVSCLKRIAREKGLTVVCTIHQPSREVFASFDNLLVLQKGGVCVYNGSIAYIKTYMQTAPNENQYIMPEGMNPADYILDMFCGSQGESEEWGDLYQKSEMAEAVLASFTSCTCEWCSSGQISIDLSPPSLLSELWIVAHRELVTYWRTPTYMAVRFGWTVVANVLVGLIYFQTSELLNIIGSIFFYVNIATVPLMSAVVPLISARAVYYREVASGTYRKTVYGIAVQIAELPFNLAFAVVSFLIFYFMVGLDRETERVAYFFLMGLASYWVFPTMGQLFAFLSPNIGAAIGMASLLMTLFTLTMGFLLPASEIPAWYIWIYWMNPLRYVQQGLVVNEVGGKEDGDDLLRPLGWAYDQRWWYCYVAVILFGFASSLGVVAATRISWLKR
jgi:ABC-type multidrug transport system ATPase subunit